MSTHSARRKMLRWAAIASGALVLVALLGYALLQRWLHAESAPLPLAMFAGADSALALVYEVRPDDPEARALAQALASQHAAAHPWPPDALRLMAHLGYADPPAFVLGLLPIHFGVVVERDGAVLRFASFSHHANLVARILAEEQTKLGPAIGMAAGRPIHAKGTEFVATWEHTHLTATTRARLEGALARLASGNADPGAQDLLAAVPRDRPLAGALLDRGGFLERALDRARDDRERSLASTFRAELGLGAEHVDSVRLSATPGHTTLEGGLAIGLESTAIPSHADRAMGTLLAEVARRFLISGLGIRHTTRREGNSIAIEFAIRDLDAFWRRATDDARR